MADTAPDGEAIQADKKGWLYKKGEFRRNWTLRYIELTSLFLQYYKVDEGTGKKVLKGTIPLRGAETDTNFHHGRKFTFRIKHPAGRIFVFDANSDAERKEWMIAIGEASLKAFHEFRAQPYLEVLELDASATLKEIKKKYRVMALKAHPDKGGDADKFLKLTEAYEMLTAIKEDLGETAFAQGDDQVLNEYEVTVQRHPGTLGFGLTIVRSKEGGGAICVKNVSGVTQIRGLVKVGDVITRLDGVPIKGMPYKEVLNKFKVIPTGSSITLNLVRSEQTSETHSSRYSTMSAYAPEASTESGAVSDSELNRARDELNKEEDLTEGAEAGEDEGETLPTVLMQKEEESIEESSNAPQKSAGNSNEDSSFQLDLDSVTGGDDSYNNITTLDVQSLKSELARLTMKTQELETSMEQKEVNEKQHLLRISKLESRLSATEREGKLPDEELLRKVVDLEGEITAHKTSKQQHLLRISELESDLSATQAAGSSREEELLRKITYFENEIASQKELLKQKTEVSSLKEEEEYHAHDTERNQETEKLRKDIRLLEKKHLSEITQLEDQKLLLETRLDGVLDALDAMTQPDEILGPGE